MKIAEGSRAVRPEPNFGGGAGTPPPHLDETAIEEWHRMVLLLDSQDILQRTDRVALAAYCGLYSQWAASEVAIKRDGILIVNDKGSTVEHPAVKIKTKTLTAIRGYLSEFGLTPATRQRLGGGLKPAKPGDDLAGFMKIAQ